MRIAATLVFMLSFCGTGYSQTWEIGGAGGFGSVRSLDVSNASGSGKAGFTNGAAFGAVLTQRMRSHFSGEVRYTYRVGDLKVRGNGQEAKLGAAGHAMHYDLLVHPKKPDAVVRPYLAAGAGAEIFRSSGTPPIFQPLNNLVVLTRTWEAVPLISVGGGIKFALGHHAIFRIDARDYATPIPSKLFATRTNTKFSGWFQDFVVLVGVSYAFRIPAYY